MNKVFYVRKKLSDICLTKTYLFDSQSVSFSPVGFDSQVRMSFYYWFQPSDKRIERVICIWFLRP